VWQQEVEHWLWWSEHVVYILQH